MRDTRRFATLAMVLWSTKRKVSVTDLRTQLASTDYGNFLANEPSPISTNTIGDKTLKNLVDQFNYLRSNAIAPLDRFLDYITCVLFSRRCQDARDEVAYFQLRIHDRQPCLVNYRHT